MSTHEFGDMLTPILEILEKLSLENKGYVTGGTSTF